MSWTHVIRLCSKFRQRLITSRNFMTKESPAGAQTLKKTPPTSAPPESKDIIMFRYENPKFFHTLNFFAVAQFVFWMLLATSATTLIDVPVKEEEEKDKVKDKDKPDRGGSEEELPFWRTTNFGQDKYKYGLGIGSALMGYGILFVSWTYILKSVRYLVLRKDRKTVAFVTYTPFGRNRIMDVPLDSISAAGSRSSLATQMPVKVKGRWFFYILDLKQGSFPQPKLFDQTVAIQRKI